MAEIDARIKAAGAKRRSCLPLDEQRASAERHHLSKEKARKAAGEKLDAMQKQLAEFQERVAAQEVHVQHAEAELLAAKKEMADIASQVAVQARIEAPAAAATLFKADDSLFFGELVAMLTPEQAATFSHKTGVQVSVLEARAKELGTAIAVTSAVAPQELGTAIAVTSAVAPPQPGTLTCTNGAGAGASAALSATSSSSVGAEEMDLDGLDDDQVIALAKLELKKQASLEGEVAEDVRAARMDAAKACVRADFKVRKKGKR